MSERAFGAVRTVLLTFGPLDFEDVRAHPEADVQQRFFHSTGLSKFFFADVCVQEHGRDVAFGEHDPFKVLFDRSGVLRMQPQELSVENLRGARQVLASRRWRFVLVEKEVRRGRQLEALAYYHAEVLGPLVEMLRLRYCPGKRGYGLKHVYADLPTDVAAKLEVLYGFTQLEELLVGVRQAEQWFDNVLEEPM